MRTMALVLLALLAGPGAALAATVPKADVKGTKDNPLLGRYEGSFIVEQATRSFDAVSLPVSGLVETDRQDAMGNRIYAPRESKDLEGRLTRTVYVLPPDRTTLEVLRNYQEEIRSKGGEILYQCGGEACGGDAAHGVSPGNVGKTGIVQWLYPREQLRASILTTPWCALTEPNSEQRYTVARMPRPSGEAYVGVVTYLSNASGNDCGALSGRVVAFTVIVEPKAREQRMVTLSSSEMRQGIVSQGHVALYGINFDFDKTDIRPDSRPQLDEIGKLLKDDPGLRLFVVGHTDNKGTPTYNLDLSRRRADAVAAVLIKDYHVDKARLAAYGVGQLAPVAPNDAEDGRAKNRRVELVAQ